jgi:hypothetical protein
MPVEEQTKDTKKRDFAMFSDRLQRAIHFHEGTEFEVSVPKKAKSTSVAPKLSLSRYIAPNYKNFIIRMLEE